NWTSTGYPFAQLGSIAVEETSAPRLLTTTSHQNISITNNMIADSGTAAVWLGNTNVGSVSGNYFLNSNNKTAVESSLGSNAILQPLVVQSSQNIATGSNTI